MMLKGMGRIVPALLAGALLHGNALADGVTPGTPPPSAAAAAISHPSGDGGSLGALSPGDRKIAGALHRAQSAFAGKGGIALDDIASARRDGLAWGEIFRHMKAEGLVREKNVGQVINKYAGRAPDGSPSPAAPAAAAASAAGTTSAQGRLEEWARPSAATVRSRLKPVARPAGGPGGGPLLTLASVRQAAGGGERAAGVFAGRG